MRVVGLISGTSADGIDAVLAEVDRGEGGQICARPLTSRWTPYPAPLRNRILEPDAHPSEVGRLHWELGSCLGEAALGVMSGRGRADLVGSHGQTVTHLPGEGVTLQLGEPAVIVERTGVPVIANFRAADVAAGGQGAPLAAFADWHLLADEKETRACLNLGAIATVTVLPAGGGLEDLTAFDVGPANMVIDALGGDHGGSAGLLGKADQGLLQELLEHPFFAQKPPKSCGREEFGRHYAQRALDRGLPRADLMATLVALTAESVAQALSGYRIDRLLISGGGVYNRALVHDLKERFRVLPTDAFGVGARVKEALAFALLAYAGWERIPAGLPNATGARHPTVLGQLSMP
jgi:anhydro-N-acetylmuramic acid kinase